MLSFTYIKHKTNDEVLDMLSEEKICCLAFSKEISNILVT